MLTYGELHPFSMPSSLCLSCTHTLAHFASAGHKAAGAHPSRLGVKMGLHPGQVSNSLKDQKERNSHPQSPSHLRPI